MGKQETNKNGMSPVHQATLGFTLRFLSSHTSGIWSLLLVCHQCHPARVFALDNKQHQQHEKSSLASWSLTGGQGTWRG